MDDGFSGFRFSPEMIFEVEGSSGSIASGSVASGLGSGSS